MSKIIEYLEKIGSVTPTPIGFGTSKPADKFPQIALAALTDVGSLTKNQADDFDFTIVKTQKSTKTMLKTTNATLKEQIWGIWTNHASTDSLESLANEGCDFFIISSFSEPADILASENLGKLIVVPIDTPEELAHSINEIPVDAIILSGIEETTNLSIIDTMRIRSIRDLLSKPVILLRINPLQKNDIKVIRDVGIQGILLDIQKIKPKELKSMKDDIGKLPPSKTKSNQSRAIIPTIRTNDQEEYDDDDDDDDIE
ncbi:MAG: hypothetical protein FI729_01635 [SAR202 cluster bacterium]|nr:hypothetical protein [SAR202 cluster bacterium]